MSYKRILSSNGQYLLPRVTSVQVFDPNTNQMVSPSEPRIELFSFSVQGAIPTDEESEVSQLGHADVERDDVLVVEDHSAEPLVVGPGAHAGEGSDRTDVKEHEDEAAAGARERLVVGRDLLRANSLEQSLHVVVIAEGDGVFSSVVWVLVSLLHLRELVRIVALAILSLVVGFLPELME